MFFNEEHKDQKGYKGGSDKNLSDIDRYIKPLLQDIEFDCIKDTNDNTSNKQRIFYRKDKNNYIRTQIIIVDDLHSIDTRANSNISEEMVNNTTEANRIKLQLQFLFNWKVFLFLYVKRGDWFVFIPYTDIPAEQYQLTYRGRPDRKNRMWIPTEYLPKFQKIKYLEGRLHEILDN